MPTTSLTSDDHYFPQIRCPLLHSHQMTTTLLTSDDHYFTHIRLPHTSLTLPGVSSPYIISHFLTFPHIT
ncbi:hypothetical protein BgiBS90_015279 [Biomphalaria glabrata]|nr:hypothetical protein BgiBS90_015279 [Biomphalaria glabrata]